MSSLYKAPRGTFDILPEEHVYWKYAEEKAVFWCRLYGYRPLSMPIFEDAQVFTRTVGGGTDIVDKEMYIFQDKGGQDLALRAEGTAPVCRAYLEHGMFNLAQPVKLYYIGPAFRYERPQAGRYRQHHQFGYEALGEADPVLDAEVIEMAWRLFLSLGLPGVSIQLNSIGCKSCRPGFLEVLKQHYSVRAENVCPDCRGRLARNPLRLLDCKKDYCGSLAEAAPKTLDYICDDCRSHFESVRDYLGRLGIPFHLNHRLVRGLDYYTRTVFEVEPEEMGGQSSLGGGGRYDDLIETLGGRPTPAVGFAAGLERIVLNLKKANQDIPPLPGPVAYVAYLGQEAKSEAIRLASELRKDGLAVIMATGDKSLKAQMRHADSLGSAYVVILGKEEIQNRTAVVRNMSSGEQLTVAEGDLASVLRSR
ncbi:MAG: histidine--tRNA ligase [Dehalococcoidia bacterium]